MNYGRTVELKIFKNKVLGVVITEELEIQADIKRTISRKSEITKFAIYNLNDTTLANFKKGYIVEFSCGYGELHLVYSGRVKTIDTTIQGTDRLTVIECNGEFDVLNKIIFNKSYKGLVPMKLVVEDILKSTTLPYTLNSKIDLSKKIKFSYTGKPMLALEKVLKLVNCTIYNDNGKLIVSEKKKSVSSHLIPLIDKESGMVGSPSKTGNHINVSTLFDYRLRLGGFVKLESRKFNITGKVTGLNYKLNSRDKDFIVKIELEEVS